jgi:SAM-dependent methyltransferase
MTPRYANLPGQNSPPRVFTAVSCKEKCRRVPDAILAHPRLASVYDAFDGDRDDLAAYLSIADELGADRVLDVGCGTGCRAVLLAAAFGADLAVMTGNVPCVRRG